MFRWIKRKWSNIKTRWTDEFRSTSISSFKDRITMGSFSITISATLINIGLVIGKVMIGGQIGVWCGFAMTGIFYPLCFIGGFGALFCHWHLSLFLNSMTYWTETRVMKIKYFFSRYLMWSWIFYAVMVSFVLIVGGLGSLILTPTALINMSAVALIIKEYFWIALCLNLIFASLTSLVYGRFRIFLLQEDIERLSTQVRSEEQRHQSMSDDANEDEIWRMKMERLGL